MKSIDSASTYRPMRLSAGQPLHIPVRAGTAVQVLAGSMRVNEPARWMAETMVRPLHHIGEGQWLQLQEGGWLEIEASGGDVHLLLVEPARPLASLWRRLKAPLRGRTPALPSSSAIWR